VAKLEAENKILKKKLLADSKRRDSDMRDIVETLKDHDRRLTILNKTPHRDEQVRHDTSNLRKDTYKSYIPEYARDSKPTTKPKPVRVRDVEISESSSQSVTSESEGDEDDMSGLYEELGKKKRR
ncbi:Hypothetical protein POVR2_LOCUS364, partial [uncultured virus]